MFWSAKLALPVADKSKASFVLHCCYHLTFRHNVIKTLRNAYHCYQKTKV
jgi:hypothetical protein